MHTTPTTTTTAPTVPAILAACSAWGFDVEVDEADGVVTVYGDETTCLSIRKDLARFGTVIVPNATSIEVW